jgi:hypothetical protein
MVPALVELALEYYRNPLRYSHLADVTRPLPRGFDDMLTAFGAALSSSQIGQTAEALSADRDELERAARFFIRHVLLDPAGDYYRYLGLTRRARPEAIRNHYLLLIRMFHPDRLAEANEADLAYSSRINAAYHVLRDAQARKDYDCGLPKGLRQMAGSDPRTFFRPTGPVVSSPRSRLFERIGGAIRRPSVVVSASLTVVALLGYLLLQQVRVQPTLRMAGGDVDGQARVVPSYLKRATEHSVDVSPDDGPAQVSASDSPQPRQLEPEHQTRGTGDRDSETAPARNGAVKVRAAPDEAAKAADAARAIDVASAAATEPEASGRTGLSTKPAQSVEARIAAILANIPPAVASTADRDTAARAKMAERPARDDPVSKPIAKASQAIDVSEPEPVPVRRADPPASAVGAPSPRRAAPADGNALVGRLEHAYRQGDANALAALFAQGARTNEGSGRGLIRNLYAGFFRRATESQLSVRGLQWQAGSDGRLIGRGQVSVSNRYRGATAWQRSRGRIQLEVADGPEGYRITEMFYQLD